MDNIAFSADEKLKAVSEVIVRSNILNYEMFPNEDSHYAIIPIYRR